ncbi:MAG: serine O-acetyltransferase [Clostridiales bacterium]|nr:serine O-acetyltransferase [Clostridiales bacterium]
MTEKDNKPNFALMIQELEESILADYEKERVIDRLELFSQPDGRMIEELIEKLFRVVFPGFFRDYTYRIYNLKNSISNLLEDIADRLNRQIAIALRGNPGEEKLTDEEISKEAERITAEFISRLPEIREYVDMDLSAAYDGDPAAAGKEEIIIAYPGLYATTVNRLAHVLYKLGVPLIPRIMTEYAHSRTGIDIHPGASIGRYFFIDHGTGIVIGETTVIGDNVKIYQGVTIGALSTRGGQRLHGLKRHPTIEDNVTIYAGASILGGDTVIGHDSIIGSNAFITRSVEPGTRVSVRNQELQFKSGSAAPQTQPEPEKQDKAPAWFYVI